MEPLRLIFFIITLLTMVGVLSAVMAAWQALVSVRQRREGQGETAEQRINRLTQALSESSHVIQEIEAEIEARSKLVEKLKQDAETYEQLKSMKREQAEAVAQTLRGELKTEGQLAFWKNTLMNFSFFLIGVATTVILSLGFGL